MNIPFRIRIGIDDFAQEEEYPRQERPLLVIAGSFDPFHNGHLELIEKARLRFPCCHILLVVYDKLFRDPLAPIDLRLEEVKEGLLDYEHVEVVSWSGFPVPEYIAYMKGAHYFLTARRTREEVLWKRTLSRLGKFIFPGMKILVSRMRGGNTSIRTQSLREQIRRGDWEGIRPAISEKVFPLIRSCSL